MTCMKRHFWYRGRALYAYQPENEHCIQVGAGKYLNVCEIHVKWLLVSLDEDIVEGRGAKRVGFVKANCVEALDHHDLVRSLPELE